MKLPINLPTQIEVQAKSRHGGDPTFFVEPGEVYRFEVLPGQRWKDWWIPSGPKGYFNFLLWFAPPRLKGVNCFALCGTIGQDEQHHFHIGEKLERYEVPVAGELYFFPNDAYDYYDNNKGSIRLTMTRLQ